MNQLNLVGNVAKTATVNNTKSGRQAINFRIAVNESHKGQDGQRQEKTTYFSATIWKDAGQSTKISQALVSGKQVRVTGSVSTRVYTDKDQQPQADLVVTVKEIELLGGGKGQGTAPVDEEFTATTGLPQNADDDNDLPF